MNKFIAAAAAACAMAAPAPAEQTQQATEADPGVAAIVADCAARKFETRVEIEKNGEKRLTKLKLCGVKDEDDAAWLRTLEDAKAKIVAHPDISDESKAKIAAEIDAEIAKVKTGTAASILSPVAPAKPNAQPDYAAPAPLTPTLAVPAKPTIATSSPTLAPAKPRLTIRCLDPGDTGAGSPCTFLERDTRLAIQADEDFTGRTSLRFLRRGDVRGEVVLAGMRRGQTIRSKLPDKLCIGVSSSKVEIQVLSANQVVETLGPYKLRC